MDVCDAFYFIANKGVALAKSQNFILHEFNKDDSLSDVGYRANWKDITYNQQQVNSDISKRDSLNQIVDKANRHYKLEAVKLRKRKSIFKVVGKADNLNEVESFSKVHWKHKSKTNPLHDSIFSVDWEYCEIISFLNSRNYNMQLRVD